MKPVFGAARTTVAFEIDCPAVGSRRAHRTPRSLTGGLLLALLAAAVLWGGVVRLPAQTTPAAPAASAQPDIGEIMNETFPAADALASPSAAGLPTPMPSPTAGPSPVITNVPGLDPALDGEIEAGIPDPMDMTFPTEPVIPAPRIQTTPDPVASIRLPPANAMELKLAPGAQKLTIDGTIQTAMTQNPEILAAIQQLRLTSGQMIQVRAALLPTVNAGSSYNATDDVLANPNRGILGSGSGARNQNQSWDVAITVNQSIWSGWQNQADFSAARLAYDSSFYSLRQTIDQVVAETKNLFYDIIFNRALIRVREESVAVLESQLQDQQSRFEAGTVPRFNVLQAEVALANAIPPVIEARNALRISQFSLVKQLGINLTDPTVMPIDVVGQLDYNPVEINLANSVFTALLRNPSLKIQRQNILIQAENLKSAMSGFQPTLNASAGWQAFNVPLAAQLDETVNGWFFGVTGSWNIFDGLATYGATKAARAALEQSKINYDNGVRGIELDVQRAVSNLIEAQQVIDSQRANVVQATEALRLSRERLDAGAGTQLDVLNAQVSLLQAQTTELEGRYRYIIALAEYNRVLSLDTVYADTYDDPMLSANERRRNDRLNNTDNPNPGVLQGRTPRKSETFRGAPVRRAEAVNQP